MSIGWAILLLLAVAGLFGLLSGQYVEESAALLLVALAVGLHRLTWGREPPGDEER